MFFFFTCKVCASEKLGASQRFCGPERVRSESGAQFVQAYLNISQKTAMKKFTKENSLTQQTFFWNVSSNFYK